MIWRIEGHSAASKEYGSKRQFIDEVLTPFRARFTTSEPFLWPGSSRANVIAS
jgi:hypothetical protein